MSDRLSFFFTAVMGAGKSLGTSRHLFSPNFLAKARAESKAAASFGNHIATYAGKKKSDISSRNHECTGTVQNNRAQVYNDC